MRALAAMALLLTSAACAPADRVPGETAATGSSSSSDPRAVREVADDGTFLRRIDPLGGQWRVQRIGDEDFTRFDAWIGFSDGGFLNHGAGCGGGHPAFYRIEGASLSVTRREPVRTGKCAGTPELANGSPALRAAAAESETRLGAFLDRVSGWNRTGDALVLTASDGTTAILAGPREPHPDIAGRWLIESIGGTPLVTERRPPTLTIAMGNLGAHADCNSMGSAFTVPAPGRIEVRGPIIGTAIGCAPEDQAEDDLMARAMRSATGYRMEGDRLVLSGDPGMVLRRPPPPDRRLAGEYEACGNTLRGAYHDGPVTLTIDQRTIRDNAHCIAIYRADGPFLDLALESGPACADSVAPDVPGEPVAIGGEISVLSVARPDAFAFTEQGQLVLRTNRGLLTMCRKGSPPPFGSG